MDAWRRRMLCTLVAVMCVCSSAEAETPEAAPVPPAGRRIVMTNTHTGETADVVFRNESGYIPEAIDKLEAVLRDHRSNERHPMDPALFDILADLAQTAGVEPRYQIISGFRSSESNAMLRSRSKGVAEKSLHLQGKAIDVRLKGVPTDKLRDLALAAARGGVGYYHKSDFVHVDTGRVRRWTG